MPAPTRTLVEKLAGDVRAGTLDSAAEVERAWSADDAESVATFALAAAVAERPLAASRVLDAVVLLDDLLLGALLAANVTGDRVKALIRSGGARRHDGRARRAGALPRRHPRQEEGAASPTDRALADPRAARREHGVRRAARRGGQRAGQRRGARRRGRLVPRHHPTPGAGRRRDAARSHGPPDPRRAPRLRPGEPGCADPRANRPPPRTQ